ncbi:hypothetical protein [Candidatus Tisiphia endosymbiont of Ptychoptera albimana]|uniref:hypothetical protein n=1 Tax=Candidatus Tisiphia endosymbiont of Ptychoptera albimana TaxID=3066260 RepID=UPI00312C9896
MLQSKGLEIIETKETSYLASLPKEPECSASTQELGLDLDLILMNLQREGIEPSGVNDD